MELWSIMLGRVVKGIIHEDNMSTIEIIKSGYSPKMRHLAKHHRISLGTVSELVKEEDIDVEHIGTDLQKGDMLTKGLARPKHEPACRLIGLYPYIIQVPDVNFASVRDSLLSATCILVDTERPIE